MFKRRNPVILASAALSLVLGLSACGPDPGKETSAPEGSLRSVSLQEVKAWAEKTLGTLSLERRIGQMICAEMRGEFIAEDDPCYLTWKENYPETVTASRSIPGGRSTDISRPGDTIPAL